VATRLSRLGKRRVLSKARRGYSAPYDLGLVIIAASTSLSRIAPRELAQLPNA
jgi:hypothetical protein